MVLLACLAACGGGGGGDAPPPWSGVTIEEPADAEVYSTDQPEVGLAGRAFIPEGSVCNAAVGTIAPGYRVRWHNAANSASGEASLQLNCLLQPSLTWTVPAVALVVGANYVTVTATASDGQTGSDAIVITRRP